MVRSTAAEHWVACRLTFSTLPTRTSPEEGHWRAGCEHGRGCLSDSLPIEAPAQGPAAVAGARRVSWAAAARRRGRSAAFRAGAPLQRGCRSACRSSWMLRSRFRKAWQCYSDSLDVCASCPSARGGLVWSGEWLHSASEKTFYIAISHPTQGFQWAYNISKYVTRFRRFAVFVREGIRQVVS